MTGPRKRPAGGGTTAIVAGAVLLIFCCAGPALLAGGAVSALGGALHSPWLIIGGALFVVGMAGFLLLRHRGRRSSESCCMPSRNEQDPLTADDPRIAGSECLPGRQPPARPLS